MIEIKHPQDLMRVRRFALEAQGLLKAQPFGNGLAGARKAIKHLGYVQIDTLSVVERAHHHVFHSRVPKFKSAMTNQMLLERDIFEYWVHAAAFLPIADFRFSLPYKHAIKNGKTHWYKNPDKKLMSELLARIRSDGPLRSREVETKIKKSEGWWDWKPAKKALDQLYMQGDLMISSREGFQKTYDLTERVLPSKVDLKLPSYEDFAVHLVDQQLRCHGLISIKGLTYQRRQSELRKAVKSLLTDRLAQGSLQQISLGNGEIFVAHAATLERPLPRLTDRMLILSPFDNSVIQRARLKSIFQFDYQLECYLPEAKRRYGYFSLPILFRAEFIGRVDCKAHRKTNHLEIKFLHFEKFNFDQDLVLSAFTKAIIQLSRFQNCHSISLCKTQPKNLAPELRNKLEILNA